MQLAFCQGEKVQIVNNNNGERLETYTIPGEKSNWCHLSQWCCSETGTAG